MKVMWDIMQNIISFCQSEHNSDWKITSINVSATSDLVTSHYHSHQKY